MNKYEFDQKELERHGIRFETVEEGKLFSDIVRKELEVSVGRDLSKNVDQEDLDDFEQCETQEESEAWLNKYCPNFRDIVKSRQQEMACQIMEFRDSIEGVIFEVDQNVMSMTVEELDMSARSTNCLKRAGIHTVRDILEFGPLSRIRNLGERCKKEVLLTLWEVIADRNIYQEPMINDYGESRNTCNFSSHLTDEDKEKRLSDWLS